MKSSYSSTLILKIYQTSSKEVLVNAKVETVLISTLALGILKGMNYFPIASNK